MAAPQMRVNPYGEFNFVITCDSGPTEAQDAFKEVGFMECSGLDGETMPMEYRDSLIPNGEGSGAYVRKLPGMERYPNVVLRRGITGNVKLWEWRKKVRDAEGSSSPLDLWQDIKATVTVTLQNEKHEPVMSWILTDAWPCKLSGPTLNAKTNEIAIEQLELCCDRIEIETAS